MNETKLIRLLDTARSKREQIIILRHQDWSYKEIKQALEVGMSTISKVLKEQKAAA